MAAWRMLPLRVYGEKMPEDLTDALTAYIKRVQADEQAELDRRKVAMARMEREPLVGAFAVGAHTCIMKFKPSVGIWTTWTPDLPAGMSFKKWFTPKQMDHYRRGRDEFRYEWPRRLAARMRPLRQSRSSRHPRRFIRCRHVRHHPRPM